MPVHFQAESLRRPADVAGWRAAAVWLHAGNPPRWWAAPFVQGQFAPKRTRRPRRLRQHPQKHNATAVGCVCPLASKQISQTHPATSDYRNSDRSLRNSAAGILLGKMVPRKGLEPSRPLSHWHLKPARLPIPPPGHWRVSIGRAGACQIRSGLFFTRFLHANRYPLRSKTL